MVAAGLMAGGLAAGGWAQDAGQAGAQKQPAVKQVAKAAEKSADDAGDRKFQQNCNRCHNAPQELRPRVTGTVLLHMRVRASLSEADEQAILRYMAP